MRFLFSFPLPLLLIFISPVVFDTKAAPSKLQEEPSPSRDYAEQSTTDIRYANSSYANRRHARQIGTDLSYDGVKPMALASEADSTETAENYEQLSFDELEKRKEQAEKDHSELKDKLNQARDALKTKEDEAKGPLDDYDKKKQAYEELKVKFDGMNPDLKKAEAEFVIAERNSKSANRAFKTATDDLREIEDGITDAEQQIAVLEGEPAKLTAVQKDLTERTIECPKLRGKETELSDDVDKKKTEEGEIKKKYDLQVTTVSECTGDCAAEKGHLTKLEGDLDKAKSAHQTAIDLAAYLDSCKSEIKRLKGEERTLLDSTANKDAKIAKERDIINELQPKKDPQQEIFDAAKLAKDQTDPIFTEKEAARDAAVSAAPYTTVQVQKAEQETTAALNQWEQLEDGHTKLLEEIGSLQTALKELEKRFATDEARVGALQKVYQKKLSGKDPGNGSATIIAVCAIVGLLLVGVGIGVFFALKRRNAKKKEQKPSGGKEKSSSADNGAPPGAAATTMKESGSGQIAPLPAESTKKESDVESATPAAKDAVDPYIVAGDGKDMILKYMPAETDEMKRAKKVMLKESDENSPLHQKNNLFINMLKGEPIGNQIRRLFGKIDYESNCQDARVFRIGNPMLPGENLIKWSGKADPNKTCFDFIPARNLMLALENQETQEQAKIKKDCKKNAMLSIQQRHVELKQFGLLYPQQGGEKRNPAGADKSLDQDDNRKKENESDEQERNEESTGDENEKYQPYKPLQDHEDEIKYNKLVAKVLAKETKWNGEEYEPSDNENSGRSRAGSEAGSNRSSRKRDGAPEKRKKRSGSKNNKKDQKKSDRSNSDKNSEKSDERSEDSRQVPSAPTAGFTEQGEHVFLRGNKPRPDMDPMDLAKHERPTETVMKALLKDLVKHVTEKPGQQFTFDGAKQKLMLGVLRLAIDDWGKEKKLVERALDRITLVYGDLHTNVNCLVKSIETLGGAIGSEEWKTRRYIFMGDYVDRGNQSVETVMILFLMLILYPENTVVLRGNHEFYETNIHYGFLTEMILRYGEKLGSDLHYYFNYAFSFMPMACFTGGLLCMHGGIPVFPVNGKTLKELFDLMHAFIWEVGRGTELWRQLACALMWNDPLFAIKCMLSTRGTGEQFNHERLDQFFDECDWVQLIARGHQVIPNGSELFGTKKKKLCTLFSSNDYDGYMSNRGGIMTLFPDKTAAFVYIATCPKDAMKEMDGEQKQHYLTKTHHPKVVAAHNRSNRVIATKGAADATYDNLKPGVVQEPASETETAPKKGQ